MNRGRKPARGAEATGDSPGRRSSRNGDGRAEDTTHAALLRDLADGDASTSFRARVCFIARARYGILPQDAEDIFHEAVATYLSIHSRYGDGDNHYGLLVGIFHKKALEHLGARERAGKISRRFTARLRAERPVAARGEDPKGTTADRLIRDEDARLIREAIDSMNDDAREMLLALAEGQLSRLEMIERLEVNPNTFDTRLRALRLKLRQKLMRSGVL